MKSYIFFTFGYIIGSIICYLLGVDINNTSYLSGVMVGIFASIIGELGGDKKLRKEKVM